MPLHDFIFPTGWYGVCEIELQMYPKWVKTAETPMRRARKINHMYLPEIPESIKLVKVFTAFLIATILKGTTAVI